MSHGLHGVGRRCVLVFHSRRASRFIPRRGVRISRGEARGTIVVFGGSDERSGRAEDSIETVVDMGFDVDRVGCGS